MFQFLIGRLKTVPSSASARRIALFQFLIGRLKTKGRFNNVKYKSTFQFLIGRLKTVITKLVIIPHFMVSIPYR